MRCTFGLPHRAMKRRGQGQTKPSLLLDLLDGGLNASRLEPKSYTELLAADILYKFVYQLLDLYGLTHYMRDTAAEHPKHLGPLYSRHGFSISQIYVIEYKAQRTLSI
jgi:hypothetical protein